MKHVIEGGTDSGSMLLFDPAALPDDYDKCSKVNPTEILETATLNGDAYWIDTGGDGGYLLHAFVNEPVGSKLAKFLLDEQHVEKFRVPSGNLYFSGMEYGFRYNNSFLKKYPHMGGSFELEPGLYRLSLYRTEYPEELMESELRNRVSAAAFRLHQSMGWFILLAVIGFSLAITSFFKSTFMPILLPVGVILFAIPFVVSRIPLYKETDRIWVEIQWNYPSIVATLKYYDG